MGSFATCMHLRGNLRIRLANQFKSLSKLNSSYLRLLAMSVWPGARFSKATETFRARKAIFSSFVSKNGEVYTPETFCMKGASPY